MAARARGGATHTGEPPEARLSQDLLVSTLREHGMLANAKSLRLAWPVTWVYMHRLAYLAMAQLGMDKGRALLSRCLVNAWRWLDRSYVERSTVDDTVRVVIFEVALMLPAKDALELRSMTDALDPWLKPGEPLSHGARVRKQLLEKPHDAPITVDGKAYAVDDYVALEIARQQAEAARNPDWLAPPEDPKAWRSVGRG